MLKSIYAGKLKSTLVSMITLLTFFNPMRIASATRSESISIGSATVDFGDTFVLPITIADIIDVTGVSLTVVYDANIVIIQNVATDSDSTTVVLGNIAPTVTIHSPSDITNNNTPLLHATFDQIAISTWYVIDEAAGTGGSNTDYLTVTLPQLADGQHIVKVYVNNSDGYVGSATQDFLVDTIAPAIMIDQVTSLTNDGSQTTTGIFDEFGSGINSITVNGVAATISDPVYSATINLTEGTNSVSVIAVDNAGNSGSNSTTIVLDTIAPTASITAPENSTEIKYFENIIKGNVSDEHFDYAELKVSSGSDASTYNLTITDNSFAQRVEFTPYQSNTLEILVFDTAGNFNTDTVTVFVHNNTMQVDIGDAAKIAFYFAGKVSEL